MSESDESGRLMLEEPASFSTTESAAAGLLIVATGLYTLDLSKRTIKWSGAEVSLTVAEVKFLQAVMRNPNQMIPVQQLQHYMGGLVIATGSAVKNTVYRLRRKLRKSDPDFNAIVWYEGGYLFEV